MSAQAAASSSNVPVVAFSQGQTSGLTFTAGDNVPFDKVLANIGASLDSHGVFTCVTPGLYAFHFYSLAKLNQEMWLDLYKNNMSIGAAYGYTNGSYGDAGNSAIVNLVAGDIVYVKAHDQFNNALYGAADQVYTTFTGVLLDSIAIGDCISMKFIFHQSIVYLTYRFICDAYKHIFNISLAYQIRMFCIGFNVHFNTFQVISERCLLVI